MQAISRRENTDDKSENKKHEIQNKVVPKNFSDAPESKNVIPTKKAETVTLSATTNSVKAIPATNLSSTFPTTDKTGAMNGSPEKKNGIKSDSESAANKLKDNSNSDKKGDLFYFITIFYFISFCTCCTLLDKIVPLNFVYYSILLICYCTLVFLFISLYFIVLVDSFYKFIRNSFLIYIINLF